MHSCLLLNSSRLCPVAAEEEEAPSPASVQQDDGAMIDQGDGGKIGGVMTGGMGGKMQAQAQQRRRAEASSTAQAAAGQDAGATARIATATGRVSYVLSQHLFPSISSY